MSAWASLRRFIHIVQVISRHGLCHLVSRRLAAWPNVSRTVCGQTVSGPNRFRLVIEEIGGTFIKFGQMLALQSDLLPLEYCKVLFTLFDQVAPFGYDQVEQTFIQDLNRAPLQIFDSFDPRPIATGSIGQVHVATLGNQKVAVKVRRPTIVSDFEADTTAMKFVVRAVKLLRIRVLRWIIAPTEEFITWSHEELDFRREGHYMDELGRNAKDNPCEKVPLVFWAYTTSRILTAEFLEGTTISEYLRKKDAGYAETGINFDPSLFGGRLVDNFLGDAFRHGMFHADLHPGNLMIMRGNVVGYIDFGISGVLSRYSRRHLIAMTLAYSRGDLDAMCESFFRITTFDKNANLQGFRQRLQEVSTEWYGVQQSHSRLRKSITSIMLDLLVVSRENGVWPQKDVIRYIRSAIALDGLVKTFSPGMDIGRHLEAACERNIKWDSMHNLISPEALSDWFGGYAHLISDGMLRLMTVLRRLEKTDAASSTKIAGPPARRNTKALYGPPLQLLWIAICVAMIINSHITLRGYRFLMVFVFVMGVAISLTAWQVVKNAHPD